MTSYNKTRIVIRDDKCFVTEPDNRQYLIMVIPYGDKYMMHIERYTDEESWEPDLEWNSWVLKLYDCSASLTVWAGDKVNWVITYGELLYWPKEGKSEK